MLGWTNTIRSGRPAFALRRLFAAYDLTEAELFAAVAQCRAILSGTSPVAWSTDPAVARRQAAVLEAAISQWQAINTSIFWHVLAWTWPLRYLFALTHGHALYRDPLLEAFG